MNRIEKRMKELQKKNEKAFVTYMTAGLPDMEGTKALIKAQAEAGIDIIELGIPFSDPTADGPVIQDASYRSICKGTNLKGVFAAVEEVRKDCDVPLVFMMYYNTILYYGVDAFARKMCRSRRRRSYHPRPSKRRTVRIGRSTRQHRKCTNPHSACRTSIRRQNPYDSGERKRLRILRFLHGSNRTGRTFPQKRKELSGKCKSRIQDSSHDGIWNPHSRRCCRIKRYD